MSSARPGSAGATRACPHCRETILESASVCPACRKFLRFDGSSEEPAVAALTPLSRLIGEPSFGAWTRALIGMGEGGIFGLGVAWGLTHRPAK